MYETSSNAQATAAVQRWLETPECQEEARTAVEDTPHPRGRDQINPKARGLNSPHSFTLVCRCAIPIGSSLVVGLSTLPPNPSACPRVGVWDKPWDKFANYFEPASPQFHFCPGDKSGKALRSGTAQKGCQNGCFPSLALA